MKTSTLLVFIFIFSCCSLSYGNRGYRSDIDSLKREFQNTGIPQSKRIKLLNDITRLYRYVNVDSSLIWANLTLQEAKNAHDETGQAWALHNIGRAYIIQDNSFIGLKNILASLKISEKTGNYELIGVNQYLIALLNEDNSDIPASIHNFEKAFDISQKAGDKRLMSWQMANIGTLWMRANDTTKAEQYFSRALKYAFELGDGHEIANAYNTIGNAHSAMGRHEEAFRDYRKALFYFTTVGNKMGMGGIHYYIAGLEAYLGRYANAIKNYDTALQYAEATNPGPGVVGILKGLSSVYSNLGDFKKAYEYYTRAENIETSISKEEMAKKAAALQTRSDFEKKMLADSLNAVELQIQQEYKLQKQRIYSFSIGGIALCFIVISSLVYRNYKGQKLSNKLLSEEKDKSESLLLNILPSEVAEELKAKGSADARLIDEVTVLFTDFKGFTTMSEKLSPEELVRDLNECFSAFDHIMSKYGIEKIKTIGDAYMAAGGLPTPNSTHPVDVVNAALEIRDFIREGKVKKLAQHLPYFEIRIGVHTGPVVAGIVGVKKFSYDIWGDTVNTASRMESSGEVGKVNISGTTYELVKDQFHCTHRGKVSAKNKGEIDMYFVERSHGEV